MPFLILAQAEIPAGFGPGSRAPQSNLQALVNTNVELICNPTGEPKPTVRWRFGPMLVQDSGRHRILSNGNLRISNVTDSDSGVYTCEASNRLAKASRKGFLSVVGTCLCRSCCQASVAPCKGIRIPDSNKFWLLESGIREILSCGIRNPGFWNPECSLRNSE